MVDAPAELVDQYFLKPFKLIDIGQIEDSELKRHAMAGAAEIMLKHIFDKDMLPVIREAADLMRRLVQQGASDYVAVVLQYTLSRGEISQEDEFFRIIRDQISPEIEDSVMTLAH